MTVKLIFALLIFVQIVRICESNSTQVLEHQVATPLLNSEGIVKVVSKILDFPHAIWNFRLKLLWKDLKSFVTDFQQKLRWILALTLDSAVVNLTQDVKDRFGELKGFVFIIESKFQQALELFKLAKLKKPLAKIFSKIANKIPFADWTNPGNSYVLNTNKNTAFLDLPSEFQSDLLKSITHHLPSITVSTRADAWKTAANWPQYLDIVMD
jgi:hypothetical protein